MEQIVSRHRSKVHLRRGFEEELGGGRDTWRSSAGRPDTQTVEARLQIGSQDEGSISVVAARMADKDRVLIEASAFQPGLQKASRREHGPDPQNGR